MIIRNKRRRIKRRPIIINKHIQAIISWEDMRILKRTIQVMGIMDTIVKMT